MWSWFQTSRQEEEEDAVQGVALGWEQTALARAYSSERRRGPQASRATRVHDAVVWSCHWRRLRARSIGDHGTTGSGTGVLRGSDHPALNSTATSVVFHLTDAENDWPLEIPAAIKRSIAAAADVSTDDGAGGLVAGETDMEEEEEKGEIRDFIFF